MDKRFVRSEKIIREAFLQLMAEQAFKVITVSDICRQAGISRNTFYLHYDSKEHLLEAMIDELIEDLRTSCQPVVDEFKKIDKVEAKRYSDQILYAINQHQFVIKILFKQEQWQFAKQLAQVIVEENITQAEKLNEPPNIPHIIYFAHGVVGFIQYWLEQTELTLVEAQQLMNDTQYFRFNE